MAFGNMIKTLILVLAFASSTVKSSDVTECEFSVKIDDNNTPFCTFECSQDVWFEGRAYQQFPSLSELGLMVEVDYQNGVMETCQIVPSESEKTMTEKSAAMNQCMGDLQPYQVPTTPIMTTISSSTTTIAPTTTTTTTDPRTTTTVPTTTSSTLTTTTSTPTTTTTTPTTTNTTPTTTTTTVPTTTTSTPTTTTTTPTITTSTIPTTTSSPTTTTSTIPTTTSSPTTTTTTPTTTTTTTPTTITTTTPTTITTTTPTTTTTTTPTTTTTIPTTTNTTPTTTTTTPTTTTSTPTTTTTTTTPTTTTTTPTTTTTLPPKVWKCPSGYVKFENSNCYFFSKDTKDWSSAKRECERKGAHLIRVESTEQQNFVQKRLSGDTWMDLNDRSSEGNFVYTDRNRPKFAAWDRGEPNNNWWREDCACFYKGKNYKWNDSNCGNEFRYVCERKPTHEFA